MTEGQALRAERRALMEQHRRERRAEAIKTALVILGLLLAYALAGALDDYGDRARNLTNMMPSETWLEVSNG